MKRHGVRGWVGQPTDPVGCCQESGFFEEQAESVAGCISSCLFIRRLGDNLRDDSGLFLPYSITQ